MFYGAAPFSLVGGWRAVGDVATYATKEAAHLSEGHVVWCDQDGLVHDISGRGHWGINTAADAGRAVGTPVAFTLTTPPTDDRDTYKYWAHVVYRDRDGHIHFLQRWANRYFRVPARVEPHGEDDPPPRYPIEERAATIIDHWVATEGVRPGDLAASDPVACYCPAFDTFEIVYRSHDGHICRLYKDKGSRGGFRFRDIYADIERGECTDTTRSYITDGGAVGRPYVWAWGSHTETTPLAGNMTIAWRLTNGHINVLTYWRWIDEFRVELPLVGRVDFLEVFAAPNTDRTFCFLERPTGIAGQRARTDPIGMHDGRRQVIAYTDDRQHLSLLYSWDDAYEASWHWTYRDVTSEISAQARRGPRETAVPGLVSNRVGLPVLATTSPAFVARDQYMVSTLDGVLTVRYDSPMGYSVERPSGGRVRRD